MFTLSSNVGDYADACEALDACADGVEWLRLIGHLSMAEGLALLSALPDASLWSLWSLVAGPECSADVRSMLIESITDVLMAVSLVEDHKKELTESELQALNSFIAAGDVYAAINALPDDMQTYQYIKKCKKHLSNDQVKTLRKSLAKKLPNTELLP